MATARDLIQDALTDIGALSEGESLSAYHAQLALRTLNRMIQQWNIQGLMVYSISPSTFSFIPNQQTYTLGTGGDFNMARPAKIDRVVVRVSTSTPNIDLPCYLYTDREWQENTTKAVYSTFPTACWLSGNYPLNTLSFWPIPTAANQVLLYTWNKTEAFDLADAVQFPNGYEEAIVSNLAVRLAPRYGIQPSPDLREAARVSKLFLASFNAEPERPILDPGIGRTYKSSIGDQSRGLVLE